MKEGLIDDLWVFVNPVLLGAGIPLFKDIHKQNIAGADQESRL
jgi:dihydrofolate reductase